jgi:hypothetical protein
MELVEPHHHQVKEIMVAQLAVAGLRLLLVQVAVVQVPLVGIVLQLWQEMVGQD